MGSRKPPLGGSVSYLEIWVTSFGLFAVCKMGGIRAARWTDAWDDDFLASFIVA